MNKKSKKNKKDTKYRKLLATGVIALIITPNFFNHDSKFKEEPHIPHEGYQTIIFKPVTSLNVSSVSTPISYSINDADWS